MMADFKKLLLPSLATAILFSTSASATPRLAAVYGQNCQLCHVNPSGGGMRNSYVTSFMGPAELPLKPLPAHEQSRWPKTKLTEQISVGTDLRLLYIATNNAKTAVGTLDNSFFQMQGDFYVAFEPDPQFLFYLDRGTGSEYEVFAMGRVLPAHGYIKGGRFVPDIGWRWDDHTHYTREKLGLDFPGATETGIEVGFTPGGLSLSAGIYNGNHGSQFDNNSEKMIVGRALYRHRLGPINAAFGGSTRWNRGPDSDERLWGLQSQAGWGKFSYIADFFGQRIQPLVDENRRNWSWIMTQELNYLPVQGLDFYLGYDFIDPDLDHESGTTYRLSIGSRIYARYFLKIEPVFRFERESLPTGSTDDKRLDIIIHGFY